MVRQSSHTISPISMLATSVAIDCSGTKRLSAARDGARAWRRSARCFRRGAAPACVSSCAA
eukprot:7369300-Prymnesium_polylepis.1